MISYLKSKIYHKRLLPKQHALNHTIFYLMHDLNLLQEFSDFWGCSVNKFNLWSIKTSDYILLTGETILQKLQKISNDYHLHAEKFILMTVPKFLGHSFNPVSFFLMYNKNDELVAVISEVHNTFGEKHCYLCRHEDNHPILESDILKAEKIFHVSPFFPVSGYYEFRFGICEKYARIKIDYYDKNQKMLTTGISACRTTLRKYQPFWLGVLFPFIGIKILMLIHYHAIILWFKKIRFFTKPKPPSRWLSS